MGGTLKEGICSKKMQHFGGLKRPGKLVQYVEFRLNYSKRVSTDTLFFEQKNLQVAGDRYAVDDCQQETLLR